MIAGIDFSTHAVDIVKLGEETDAATWHRFELQGQDAFDRARSVRAAMPGSSFWDDVLGCGIEQPRGNHGVVYVARIQGAVLGCLPRTLLVQPWNPSEWRTACGMKGNASKDDVSLCAHGLRGRAAVVAGLASFPLWPQDACDAYCIALATRSRLERKDAA